MTRKPSEPLAACAAITVPLAALLLAGCRGHGERRSLAEQTSAEVAVRTVAVRDTSLSRPIRGVGVLAPREETPLAFKIGGVIARIRVEEGQTVRAGERLASLEPSEIDAMVSKAAAAHEFARRELERARALHADSVITRSQLDGAETAARVAAGDLEIARHNRLYADIDAPSDGTVLRRLAEPGQIVGPGTPVLVLGASSRGQVVRVGLADRDAAQLEVGDTAEVIFDALPGETRLGRVAAVGAAAAPGTGAFTVEISLGRPVALGGGTARPISGLVGTATLRPSRLQRVRLIPVEALLEGDGDRAFVWSLDAEGRPRRHAVRVAFLEHDRVAVADGLQGIERVVTEGAAYLTSASRVRECLAER